MGCTGIPGCIAMLDDKLDSRCRCQWRVRGRRGDFQLQRAQTRAVPRPGTRGRLLLSVLRPGLCLVNLKPAPQAWNLNSPCHWRCHWRQWKHCQHQRSALSCPGSRARSRDDTPGPGPNLRTRPRCLRPLWPVTVSGRRLTGRLRVNKPASGRRPVTVTVPGEP